MATRGRSYIPRYKYRPARSEHPDWSHSSAGTSALESAGTDAEATSNRSEPLKRSLDDMSKDQLIQEIHRKERLIKKQKMELDRLRKMEKHVEEQQRKEREMAEARDRIWFEERERVKAREAIRDEQRGRRHYDYRTTH